MVADRPRWPHPLVWLTALALTLPAAAPGLEVEVASQFLSGRFSPRHSSELGAVSLALATHGRFRIRAEVPYLEVRVPEAVVLTSLGLSPRQLRSIDPERLRALVERAGQWRSGLGDVRLAVATDLAGGGARLYRLAGELEVKAPTADEKQLLGTGEWDLRLGLDAQRRSWSLTGFAGLGWNRLGEPADLELNDVFDAYLGVESEPIGGKLRLSSWLEGNGPVAAGADSRLVVGVGLRGGTGTSWQGGLTVGLTDGSEEVGVQLGVSFNAAGDRRRYR